MTSTIKPTLKLILGDQLNCQHSWFAQPSDDVIFVMMEVRQETDYVLHHAQKIIAIFAGMRDLAARLSGALLAADADLAMAVTYSGSEPDGVSCGANRSAATPAPSPAPALQRHPVFCLLKTTLLTQLNAYMADGGRRMQSWMKTLAMVEVPFNDAAAFSNINTLQELQQFERHPP